MSVSVDNIDVLLYNPDIMKEYKILDFAGIDFPFWIDRGTHHGPCSPHTHNFIELEIVISGSADHVVEGKTYQIGKGDVLIILPTFVHELQNVQELEIYNYKFDLDKLILLDTGIEKLSGFQSLFIFHPSSKYQHEFTSHIILDEANLNYVYLLSEMILAEWKERKEGYQWVIKSYFLALITYLSRHFCPSVTHSSPKIQEIANTVAYIHENLSQKITLSTLSSMACLSERQYSRLFKSFYGVPPMEYVINCRLNLACKMMKNTDKSLQEISIACGFGDKVSFTRLFKKRYQMNPGEYRKRLK